ncbi:hypothetical protein NC653_037164 [Populus alba x Populus x berolinensis]|uniref:Uncharacterized protein n=1 Tax=Populus alba x Populus x berolinensis TaxID=444605 RepID=A0AAD6LGE3_9ROSI|nr:hypothetical protein NC653_037164 [Populus alba x Populus x berolinensis]
MFKCNDEEKGRCWSRRFPLLQGQH